MSQEKNIGQLRNSRRRKKESLRIKQKSIKCIQMQKRLPHTIALMGKPNWYMPLPKRWVEELLFQ